MSSQTVNQADHLQMETHFLSRTNLHRKLVQKFCQKIYQLDPNKFQELPNRATTHDQSKYDEPEKIAYIYITWKYHCRDNHMEFLQDKDMETRAIQATEHHIKTNRHHPEFHSTQETNLINPSNRDRPNGNIIDATLMEDLDIAEMVADWCAVSEERGTCPFDWAMANIGTRWKFTDRQEVLIHWLINKIW